MNRVCLILATLQALALRPLLCAQCELNVGIVEKESSFSYISCHPGLREHAVGQSGVWLADPQTVCIFTCKFNVYRYKHRCNRSGNWDLVPGALSCERPCPDPQLAWPLWKWTCDNQDFRPGSSCQGHCEINQSVTDVKAINCTVNRRWSVPEEINSCEPPKACPDPNYLWPQWLWSSTSEKEFLPGTRLRGTCRYESSVGEIAISCQMSGEWEVPEEVTSCPKATPCPKCQINCIDPEDLWPEWLWSSEPELTPGTSLTGICRHDPSIGEITISCQASGEWELPEEISSCHLVTTQCPLPIICSDPEAIWPAWEWECQNGFEVGSTCDGKCALNSETNASITCESDGNWDFPGDIDECLPSACPDPSTLWPNWAWDCWTIPIPIRPYANGTQCWGRCRHSNLTSVPEITCQDSGLWQEPSGGWPDCEVNESSCSGHFYDGNVVNGRIHCHDECISKFIGVVKTCVLNCDPGYVPSRIEVYFCDANSGGLWRAVDGELLSKTSFKLSCELPVAVLAGGWHEAGQTPSRSVELYHPTKIFNVTVPDLPQVLYKISGFWFNGSLIFCGLAKGSALDSMTCFSLSNTLKGLKWAPYSRAIYYVRSVSPAFVRPHDGWWFYVIDGNTDEHGEEVVIFNPISLYVTTQEALGHDLGHHCTFVSDSGRINVINEDGIWFFTTGNGTTDYSWEFIYLDVRLENHECMTIGDQVLIIDYSSVPSHKYVCGQSGFDCRTIEFEFSAPARRSSKMVNLDGIVHVLGGSETRVDQLFFDSATGEIKVTSAKNSIKMIRHELAVVEVAESFFDHN